MPRFSLVSSILPSPGPGNVVALASLVVAPFLAIRGPLEINAARCWSLAAGARGPP